MTFLVAITSINDDVITELFFYALLLMSQLVMNEVIEGS